MVKSEEQLLKQQSWIKERELKNEKVKRKKIDSKSDQEKMEESL
jgi:hypothetical protein